MDLFFKKLSRMFPALSDKLAQAGIMDTTDDYVRKTFLTALMMSIGLAAVFFVFIPKAYVFFIVALIATPGLFLYFLKYVDVKIEKLKRQIEEEIVFAGKFLVIELESGVPMHKAFENVEKNYGIVGVYFGEITNKMYLGVNLEDAINDVLMDSPSLNLRRILWQLLNSIKTGSDVAPAISSVIDQIVKEQQIAVKEYGKKLNPLAMFYMMIAVIVPSLGTTILVVMATFLNLTIGLTFLIALAAFIGFVQMMFLSAISSTRPPISMQ